MFSSNSCPFILVRFFLDWVFLANRSVANTKQLSRSHGGQPLQVSPVGKWVWVESHRITYDWQRLPVIGINRPTILRFKQGCGIVISLLWVSHSDLPFQIARANDTSKSVW